MSYVARLGYYQMKSKIDFNFFLLRFMWPYHQQSK